MPNLLAIDNGTQSVKAILFDPRGNLLAKSQVPFEPYFSDVPGWAGAAPPRLLGRRLSGLSRALGTGRR